MDLLSLSCDTNDSKGGCILHEQEHNTGHEVQAIPFDLLTNTASAVGGLAGMEPRNLSATTPAAHSIIPISMPEEELTLIRNMRRRNPKLGITELWYRLKKRGHSRNAVSLYRIMRREGLLPGKSVKKPSADFLKKVASAFAAQGAQIKCVQTDNGLEFINCFSRG